VKERIRCHLWWKRWWLGSSVVAATMLLLFPCIETSPCVFSFFFFSVFTLSVLSSLSLFFSSPISFYSSVIFFFLSLFSFSSFFSLLLLSFFSRFCPPLLLSLPLSSHGTRVRWPRRLLCSHPRTT